MGERRYIDFVITMELVHEWFEGRMHEWFEKHRLAPAGSRVVAVREEFCTRNLVFRVENEIFPVVPEWAEVPRKRLESGGNGKTSAAG